MENNANQVPLPEYWQQFCASNLTAHSQAQAGKADAQNSPQEAENRRMQARIERERNLRVGRDGMDDTIGM